MKRLKEDIRDNHFYAYSAIDNTKDSALFKGSSTLFTLFWLQDITMSLCPCNGAVPVPPIKTRVFFPYNKKSS